MLVALITVVTLAKLNNLSENENQVNIQENSFHISVIADKTNSSSYADFYMGIMDITDENHIGLDFYHISDENWENDLERAFDISLIAEVDGIIVNLKDDYDISLFVKKAKEAAVPLTVVSNNYFGEADIYISSNNYDLGKKAVKLADESTEEISVVGLILSKEYHLSNANLDNTYVKAMKDYERENDTVIVDDVRLNVDNQVEIELKDMLENTLINTIICTSPEDSEKVISYLVDLNIITDYTVIASGQSEKIKDYISKGTIDYSINENNYLIGKEAISSLIQKLRGEFIPSFIDIKIEILNSEEVSDEE